MFIFKAVTLLCESPDMFNMTYSPGMKILFWLLQHDVRSVFWDRQCEHVTQCDLRHGRNVSDNTPPRWPCLCGGWMCHPVRTKNNTWQRVDQLPSGTNGHPVRRWCLLQKNVIQVYYRCEVVALTLCDAEDECHLLVFFFCVSHWNERRNEAHLCTFINTPVCWGETWVEDVSLFDWFLSSNRCWDDLCVHVFKILQFCRFSPQFSVTLISVFVHRYILYLFVWNISLEWLRPKVNGFVLTVSESCLSLLK